MRCRIPVATAAVLLGAGLALGAQPIDREQAEALARRAAERIAALRAESDRLGAEQQTLLGDLHRLEVERELRDAELARARDMAAQVAADAEAMQRQVTALDGRARASLPDIQARLVTLYKLGRGRYARLLFSATDSRQFAQAVRLTAAVAEQDRQRLEQYRRQLEEVAAARVQAQRRQEELRELEASAARARASAERAVERHLTLVRNIESQRDLTVQYAAELQGAQRRLQAVLAGFANPSSVGLPIRPFKGDLDWPVPGSVRSRFGDTVAGRPPARGIEIAAPEQAAVNAVHEGRIAFADTFAGFGRLVIVDHGSQTFSLYGNLGEVQVAEGARVQRGDPVGTVGLAQDGSAAIYFELRVDGQPVDPLQWLAKR